MDLLCPFMELFDFAQRLLFQEGSLKAKKILTPTQKVRDLKQLIVPNPSVGSDGKDKRLRRVQKDPSFIMRCSDFLLTY